MNLTIQIDSAPGGYIAYLVTLVDGAPKRDIIAVGTGRTIRLAVADMIGKLLAK